MCALAASAQVEAASPNRGYTRAIPYKGSVADALAASAAGSTIPMTSGKIVAAKDSNTYDVTIVGGNPLAASKTSTTINFLIVPVIVDINATTFDPTASDGCLQHNMSPLMAFVQSPLIQSAAFDGGTTDGHASLVNGVDVGTVTYPDAFRRAEFWSKVAGSNYHTRFKVSAAPAWTITASDVQNMGGGNVLTSGCALVGVLPSAGFENYISNTVIPGVPEITPTTFVLFLLKDVVTSDSSSLNCSTFCVIGYHSAFGSPVQTYAVAEYDSTYGNWAQQGIKDISIITHEIGEWMDDPLVANETPAWGNIGQVSGCDLAWEVGDPLTGTDFPGIPMANGIIYHPQELAFWSWFYAANGNKSLGAGGKFSMNGTFQEPSQPCPPGGTY